MFRLLQNVLNLSEIKLPPESDIVYVIHHFLKKKMILHISIKLSADKSSSS